MDYINYPQKTAYQGVATHDDTSPNGSNTYDPPHAPIYDTSSTPSQYGQDDPSKTAYYGVSSVGATTPDGRPPYNRKDSRFSTHSIKRRFSWNRENRAWWKTVFVQLFAVAWLIPIIALLYLNIHGYIIGASAWCPDGNCRPNIFGIDKKRGGFVSKLTKFDKDSHNLLGALQFVAKALEVWFAMIATALVYLITMHLAGLPEGLPIGYIFRPNEFTEVTGLLDPLLWTSMTTPRGKAPLKRKIYAFIAFTILLCILCNLMGPAIAVLVLPTLQWVTAPKVSPLTFGSWGAGLPPAPNNAAFNNAWSYSQGTCTEDTWSRGGYSCAEYPYGSALDALMAGYAGTQDSSVVTSQAGYVLFTFNETFQISDDGYLENVLYWTPARQMLNTIANDFENILNISRGVPQEEMQYPGLYDTYTDYNKSLSLLIERDSPILGATPNMHISYDGILDWTVPISDDKALKCYSWYDTSSIPAARLMTTGGNYTKCVTYGNGWGGWNSEEAFSIAGFNDGPGVEVTIFSSNKAAFLPNGTVPEGISPDCIYGGGTAEDNKDCDWDALFVVQDPHIALRTGNVTTMEYFMNSSNFGSVTLTTDFTAIMNFSTYTFDPYPDSNPISLVETPNLPRGGTPVSVDPNWLLVGFGVDRGGVLHVNRTAPAQITNMMTTILTTRSSNVNNESYGGLLDYVTLLPIIEAMSIVDYTIYDPSELPASELHPVMHRWAKMYVWAFGMYSRTAYLGIIVTVLGCLVVFVQLFMGVISRREYRSSTQMLVAALEHSPQDEFHETGADEKEIARVRFHIREKGEAGGEGMKRVGTFEFEKKTH